MNKEIWRKINLLDREYEISTHGKLRSFISKQLMTISIRMGGDRFFMVQEGRKPHAKTRAFGIARLIGKVFLGLKNSDMQIDHINNIRDDDRLENLRIVTRSQNQANRRKTDKKCNSQYKGVSFDKRTRKYTAYISKNRKRKWLGSYKNETEAARAYDKEAIELSGIYAKINFPILSQAKGLTNPK